MRLIDLILCLSNILIMAINPHSEPAKMEQIIIEFFSKSLHIILESRCPFVSSRNYSGDQILHSPSSSPSSSSSMRPRNKWFNLALRDCPAALQNIDFWQQTNLEPMVVDIVLVQRPVNWEYITAGSPKLGLERNFPIVCKSDTDEFNCGDVTSEKVIERWIVQYESKKGCKQGSSWSKTSNSSTSSHSVYKKSILLLRSLYATLRLLPAYKVFREINSSGHIRSFSLIHRVSSSSSVEPLLLSRDETEMQPYMFTPVDTCCGKLCISLMYLQSISDTASESSTPMSPQFISDYVGSPLADPLKRLPCVPIPQYSPTSSRYSSLEPPHQIHATNLGYDEYFLTSPNFSPSQSPSPPVGNNMLKLLLCSDSAPVYIPAYRLGDDAPLISKKTILPVSSPCKAGRPNLSLVERSSGMHSSATDATGKLLYLREEEIVRPSDVKISSNSSPQKSLSRSFSRLSFEDSYDDSDFSGPFVVDDDDTMDHSSRPVSSDRSGNLGTPHECHLGPFTPRKSQDAAAVGALVQMLKKAPSLKQELNQSQNMCKLSRLENVFNQIQNSSNLVSSRVCGIKTTSDALEELKVYTDMKRLLLRQLNKS